MTTFDELDQKLLGLIHVSDRIEKEVAPEIRNQMRNTAVAMIDYHHAIDTGALRNSITGASDILIREDDLTLLIGIQTRMEYAKYVEYGTGNKGSAEYDSPETGESYSSDGVTFKPLDKWFQPNPDYRGDPGKNNDPRRMALKGFSVGAVNNTYEEYILRFAQHPRPFMRPALYDNVPFFKDLLEEKLSEDFA